MQAKNVTSQQMHEALEVINKKYYADNVIFNRFEQKGKTIHFTLRVRSSKGPGHRLGHIYPWDSAFERRRLTSACWHVHGHFFDALLEINPAAVIITQGTKRVDVNGGNWQDWNIGS